MKNKPFPTKEDLYFFIRINIPFCVKTTKKAKTMFVDVFKTEHAFDAVVNKLTDCIWEKLNQK